jgi:hypothetical protein
VVDISEKFSNVAFENPACFGIVFTDNIGKFAKSVNGFMSAFAKLAGI